MNGTIKRNPLLLWSSILVGLQILTGGAALGDVIGLKAAGMSILVVAALQGGTSFYVRGQVAPLVDVITQLDSSGSVIAGGAAAELEAGEQVPVVPDPESGEPVPIAVVKRRA